MDSHEECYCYMWKDKRRYQVKLLLFKLFWRACCKAARVVPCICFGVFVGSVMDVNVDELCCVRGCLSSINAILKNCSRAVSRNRCFTAVRRRCEKSVCAWDTADYTLRWCMVGGCDRGCLLWCHFKQLHRMFYGTFLQQWDRRFVSGCGNNGWRMQISKLFAVDGSARVKAILTNCMDLQRVKRFACWG